MNTANLNTLIQRYEDNFEWINNAEHDEIFKWRAVRCFQDVWFSEEVEDMTFAEKFWWLWGKYVLVFLLISIMGRYPPQTGS